MSPLFGALCLIAAGCLIRSFGIYSGLWLGTLLSVLVAALGSGLAAPLSDLSGYAWKLLLGIWFALAMVAVLCWWPHLISSNALAIAKPVAADRSVWRSPIAWQVSMFMALQTVVFYTLVDWFPATAASAGISATQASSYLFAYQAIAVVADLSTSVAIKYLSDQRLLGFICSLAIVIGVSGLLYAPSLSLVWLLFAGVGAGMSMVTCLTLFGLRARDHHQARALSVMGQCIGYGLGASGRFLAGWLHETWGSWDAPLTVLLGAACLQVVFAISLPTSAPASRDIKMP